jgi:Phage integrase family
VPDRTLNRADRDSPHQQTAADLAAAGTRLADSTHEHAGRCSALAGAAADAIGVLRDEFTDRSRWATIIAVTDTVGQVAAPFHAGQAPLRDARLHDARHTAATVLLILGVPERAVMGLMGWSNTAMVARYQHLTTPVLDGVADQLGALLWGTADQPTETKLEVKGPGGEAAVDGGPEFAGGGGGV